MPTLNAQGKDKKCERIAREQDGYLPSVMKTIAKALRSIFNPMTDLHGQDVLAIQLTSGVLTPTLQL